MLVAAHARGKGTSGKPIRERGDALEKVGRQPRTLPAAAGARSRASSWMASHSPEVRKYCVWHEVPSYPLVPRTYGRKSELTSSRNSSQ